MVAFVTLEGKGERGLAVGWEETNTSQIYYIVAFATCVRKGGWGGMEKNPARHQKYILHLLYVLYCICNICGKGGKGVGDGGLDTNPTHHQNCIIFGAFVILVAFATCVGTHRKCIAAYKSM